MSLFQGAVHTDASHSTINNVGQDQYNIHIQTSTQQILQKLEPTIMDASERAECLPGTRIDVIQTITNWATEQCLESRVLWLHGLAGSGKSTLATTIARQFEDNGLLGAFLFFERAVENHNRPSNVIRTIAHQLGSSDPRIGTQISAALENIHNIPQSLLSQFSKLLVEPLTALQTLEAPILLVLDALDECGNAYDRETFLVALATESVRLPSFIRLLITSRAEPDIKAAFMNQPHVSVRELDVTSEHNRDDILSYLRNRLLGIRSANFELPLAPDWPGEPTILALARRAAGLFVWASTACRFIDGYDPQKRIDILMRGEASAEAQSALDNLYNQALDSVGKWDDADFCSDFQIIMGTIISARNPLLDSTIDELLSLPRRSRHLLSKLECVVVCKRNEVVRIIHPSFADFLLDSRRCGNTTRHIDMALHNRRLAIQCVDHLHKSLMRNICHLVLSTAPVHEVLSGAIAYASTYWIDHTCDVQQAYALLENKIEELMFQHLLHWLEAMSILKQSRATIILLGRLLDWAHVHLRQRERLIELISDACRFCQTFADSIEEHPLLVYMTALPFTPVNCVLFQTFSSPDIPWIVGGYNKSWSALLRKHRGHRDEVSNLVFSSDGTKLVSSSLDKTICVWDVTSGAHLFPPITCRYPVRSVAISPDGRCIASGSGDDHAICVWNANSGEIITQHMRGHRKTVHSVAFSPDGARIVSSSDDGTIRVWEVSSGLQLITIRPILGKWGIMAAAYSPDGTMIVSWAEDGIKLFDSMLGTAYATSFWTPSLFFEYIVTVSLSPDSRWVAFGITRGRIFVSEVMTGLRKLSLQHELSEFLEFSSHMGVEFTADGARIVSIFDGSYRIWDISTGAELYHSAQRGEAACMTLSPMGEQYATGDTSGMIALWDAAMVEDDPLNWAASRVESVQLSPHEQRVAFYCFEDPTIYLWDALHMEDSVTLQGHDDTISTMAFSPCSFLIASGSRDNTVRVWNTISGAQTLAPLRHESRVTSVAFSPDGSHIISGSSESTVRAWSATSGALTRVFEAIGEIDMAKCSPDGTKVLAACSPFQIDGGTGTLFVWDMESWAPILTLQDARFRFWESVTFSVDSQRVVAYGNDDDFLTSFDMFGACIKHRKYFRLECDIDSPIIITPDAWIVHVATRTVISKLPSMATMREFTASATSIAFVTDVRESLVIIMHFPPSSFTSHGTWNLPVHNWHPLACSLRYDEDGQDNDH